MAGDQVDGDALEVRHGSALEVQFGSKEGARLSFKSDGELVGAEKVASIHTGRLEQWTRVAVLAGGGDRARFWLLEPGEEVDVVGHAGFYVRGRMRVVVKENNARRAREAFKAFARGSQIGEPSAEH